MILLSEVSRRRIRSINKLIRVGKQEVCMVLRVEMEALYRMSAWPLYIKFGHAYEAFCASISDPDSIFNDENTPGLSADLRAIMLDNIAKRLTPTAIKIRADIE